MNNEVRLITIFSDTNSIYTNSSYFLLSRESKEIINESQAIKEFQVDWYIPQIVFDERVFQTAKKAREHLDSALKIHHLVKVSDIPHEELVKKIQNHFKKELTMLPVKIARLNFSKVKWKDIVNASVYREPPFQDDTKEKGFRDSIILETFLNYYLKNNSIHRIFMLLSNDNKLLEALEKRVIKIGANNIVMKRSIDKVHEFINLNKYNLYKDQINRLKPKALLAFYNPEIESGLIIDQKIIDALADKYPESINDLYGHANFRI